MANTILLGEGVFSIDGVDIALTRGGGQWTVEREYKIIEADGDKGPVKGRIRKTGSIARLVVRALELLPENLPKLYPATEVKTETGTTTFRAKADIEDSDYIDEVTWTGRTLDGRGVIITIENAINLENIDWTMAPKDEVVPQITYTATYDPEQRDEEPWSVQFTDVA
jgi:hypothetical protein